MSLLVHLKFDETSGLLANDSSGNGFNGALTNMVGDEWIDGKINGALDLAVDDYVDCGDPVGLDIVGNEISVSAWVRLDSISRMVIADKESSTAYQFRIQETNRLLLVCKGQTNLSSVANIPVGVWTHIGVTAQNSIIRYFVNGVFLSQTNFNTSMIANAHNLNIGRSSTGGNNFQGGLDDVRIYDNKLTDEEMFELYNLAFTDFTPGNLSTGSLSSVPIMAVGNYL